MVLQVLADTGQVAHDRDAVPAQQRRRADARQLQQLRRLDRAGFKQDVAVLERQPLHRKSAVEG